jgi:hypothetical protein
VVSRRTGFGGSIPGYCPMPRSYSTDGQGWRNRGNISAASRYGRQCAVLCQWRTRPSLGGAAAPRKGCCCTEEMHS